MSRSPFEYTVVEMTDAEMELENQVYGGLADSVRELNEATLRTTLDHDAINQVRAEVDALTRRLTKSQIPGSFGVVVTTSGRVRGHGNAVVGIRNPNAVPLTIIQDHDRGAARAQFALGALHEGPPGMVHGGVLALVLDQVFGEAAAAGGVPGMTGTLTLRYRHSTPLGQCSAEAWLDRVDGVKSFVKGNLRRADGEITVEAEGVFILPRWAREEIAKSGRPPRYE